MSNEHASPTVRASESLKVIRDATYSLRPLVPPDVSEPARRRSIDGHRPMPHVPGDMASSSTPDAITTRVLSSELGEENASVPSKYAGDSCVTDAKLVFEAMDAVRVPKPLDARDIQDFIDAKKATQNLTPKSDVKVVKIDSGNVCVRRAGTPQ